MSAEPTNSKIRIVDNYICPECKNNVEGRLFAVEYPLTHPDRYDGISEWRCPDCSYREGRWTGNRLNQCETEPRYGI
jgi:DNA-directed RNA polymerase subunit RPC12/RpoP